uniref:Ig-like domain-containing protein n=1 Tax=Caenorhabditis tropicalis TaxID=1561998 RepID=A0A1I7U4W2_9PELO
MDTFPLRLTHTVSGQYHSVHILEIRNVQQSHFGVYRCVAKNDNGIHHSQVTLRQISHDHFTQSNLIPEGSGEEPRGYSEDDEVDEDDDDEIEEENGPFLLFTLVFSSFPVYHLNMGVTIHKKRRLQKNSSSIHHSRDDTNHGMLLRPHIQA